MAEPAVRAPSEDAPAPRRGWRRVRHTLRPLWNRPLVWLSLALGPPLYMAYMRLVYATSRVEENDFGRRLQVSTAEHDGTVVCLWHEEVFTVAYGYGVVAGLRPHTLASAGDAGELVTRVLERCGYQVFRGGSTRHHSRRRPAALLAMVRHMKNEPGVLYGITVDGSNGPPYHMKPGALEIARRCGKPVYLARTWYRRSWRLRTWDRTAIPLPWNHIVYRLQGPYPLPDDVRQRDGFERFTARLEADLLALAAESYDAFGQPRPAALRERLDA